METETTFRFQNYRLHRPRRYQKSLFHYRRRSWWSPALKVRSESNKNVYTRLTFTLSPLTVPPIVSPINYRVSGLVNIFFTILTSSNRENGDTQSTRSQTAEEHVFRIELYRRFGHVCRVLGGYWRRWLCYIDRSLHPIYTGCLSSISRVTQPADRLWVWKPQSDFACTWAATAVLIVITAIAIKCPIVWTSCDKNSERIGQSGTRCYWTRVRSHECSTEQWLPYSSRCDAFIPSNTDTEWLEWIGAWLS